MYEFERKVERANNELWDRLLAHKGHQLVVACYGNPEDPENVSLECEDCCEVVLDAEIYTICACEDEAAEPLKLEGLTVAEIIRNLEDQVRDRESSIDPDDPDCIFRRDAAALRAAVKLLRDMEART